MFTYRTEHIIVHEYIKHNKKKSVIIPLIKYLYLNCLTELACLMLSGMAFQILEPE